MRKRIAALLIALSVILASIAIVYSLNQQTSEPARIRPHEPIEIHSNAEFTSENGVVSGDGSEESPYIIENWQINATPFGGIWITDTDAHFTIRNVLIRGTGPDNTYGISCYRVSNGDILDCTIGRNFIGITAASSSGFRISGNIVYNNSNDGIGLEGCSDSTVERNIISSGVQAWAGIYLALGTDNITVANNLISSIHNSLNLGVGISAFRASNLSIEGNNISGCDYGIDLYLSDDSSVYHNILSGNSIQAFDNGLGNRWSLDDYPGGWGNFWSDYNGTDANGDGIGDTPYSIPVISRDMYPLMSPYAWAPTTGS